MNKEVKYNGYSAQPSDYECQDGDLAFSLNLINENGGLTGLYAPFEGLRLTKLQTPLLLHRVGDKVNLIFCEKNPGIPPVLKYRVMDNDNPVVAVSPEMNIGVTADVLHIRAIGNVVVLSHKDNLEYILWDADKDNYTILGSSLPDVRLSFALDSELVWDVQSYGEIDWVSSSLLSEGSEDDEVLNTSVFPGGTIILDKGGSSCIDLPSFEVQQGTRYGIEVDCNLVACYYYVYYGAADCGEETHTQALFGMCQGRKEFLAEKSGPVHFRLVSFAMDDQGHIAYDNYTIPSSVSVSLLKSGSGNIGKNLKIPANTPENINIFTARLNKFIYEKATKANRFIYPFFLRYALRLFDGTHAALSAPVLMIPNSDCVPLILSSNGNTYGSDSLLCTAFVSQISFRIDSVSNLELWNEVVAGIDIFVSAPVWTYDQAVSATSFNQTPFRFIPASGSLGDYFSIGRHKKGAVLLDNNVVDRLSFKSVFDAEGDDMTNKYKPYWIRFSPRAHTDVMKDLESVSQFYKIHSFDADEILRIAAKDDGFVCIDLKKDVLEALVSRQVLEDNLLSVSGYSAPSLFDYNSRLNIFGFGRSMPQPLAISQCASPLHSLVKTYSYMRVHIQTSSGMRYIDGRIGPCESPRECLWMFYPAPNAKRIEIIVPDNGRFKYWNIQLYNHEFLNGSYAMAPLSSPFLPETVQDNPLEVLPEYPDSPVPSRGVVYLSDVNNPFVFRTTNTVSVPCNEIIGLSSAARPLSQGQFGQFPLYAFTTEGIWALEVSSAGTYVARQPITRDVCINPDGITQIDSAVLFPTDRGIMLLSGLQTECISDSIDSDNPFDLLSLPKMDRLHSMLGHSPDACLTIPPFSSFLRKCGILYDYVHQRIILYTPTSSCAFVYSIKSRKWGMMHSTIRVGMNSYPEAVAVDNDNQIVNFSESDATHIKCLYVTRPLKLDAVNIHKTIDNIIQRGNFRKGHVQSVLYGSRDLVNWHLVWSSKDHYLRGFRGTPYKYFRIAGIATLNSDESIYGASVQFTPRLINQPR